VAALQARIPFYNGNVYKELGYVAETTSEGVTALNEVITYL
jgi:hypothetical protein